MSDLYLKATEIDKYNSRGDYLHLDIDYLHNAVRLDFDSCTALTLDNGSLIIGMNVTSCTGITTGNKSLTLPLPMCFTLHSESDEYELFDMDEYKKSKDAKAAKKKCKQQPVEALLLKAIAAQGLDFSIPSFGFISIATTPNDESFSDGTFPIEKYRFCIIDKLADGAVNPLADKKLGTGANAANSGGSYGKAAQTELSKLFDRQSAIKTVSNAWLNNIKGTDIKADDCLTSSLMSEALNDANLRDYLSLILGVQLPVRSEGFVPPIGKSF